MVNKRRDYILFISGFLVLVYLASLAPRPLDRTPSFSKSDKIPFGSFILYELLPDLFPAQPIHVNHHPLRERLTAPDFETASNFILINLSIGLDPFACEALFAYLEAGGQVFLAAERFGGHLADTLKLATSYFPEQWADSVALNFTNPTLRSERGYRYRRDSGSIYFTRFDTSNCVVLGRSDANTVHFIRMDFGKGALFLSSVPLAFTNYHAVAPRNGEYIFKALSYLPVRTTYWDEYYKIRREQAQTPLRFVLSQPALRAAYFTALAGMVLFVLFQSRRRQRIIPLIRPPENTSVQFVKTMGRLYFQRRNHKNLAEKQIAHFWEHLRTQLYVKTDVPEEELTLQISQKSGVPKDRVSLLLGQIRFVQAAQRLSGQQLMTLSQMIQTFYQTTRS